jgi:hypothetical protein
MLAPPNKIGKRHRIRIVMAEEGDQMIDDRPELLNRCGLAAILCSVALEYAGDCSLRGGAAGQGFAFDNTRVPAPFFGPPLYVTVTAPVSVALPSRMSEKASGGGFIGG